jgi:hypothetical protein
MLSAGENDMPSRITHHITSRIVHVNRRMILAILITALGATAVNCAAA